MKKIFSILCVAVLAGTLFFNTSLIAERGDGIELSSIIASANAQIEEPEEVINHTYQTQSCWTWVMVPRPGGIGYIWEYKSGEEQACVFAHNQTCYRGPCVPY